MQKFMTKVNEAKVEYYKQKEYLENRIELRQQQIERLQKRRDKQTINNRLTERNSFYLAFFQLNFFLI